ncbi:hypothetical protein GOPIP_093_00250 [Gordonia polyisoprenivorans NBRC 16320 = JCM 10675]|uniref:Translation initiation factor n=1 Tax=Gordonia polyisoprenivorans TaxID=84595 RepID=A0A846WTU9_9ACTN|nr:DUF6319 family protein [Gordonia polyisoprenivorans]NKY05148.1 hypothetical protein [Gordonia polyisoprenivorans]GAB26220.1 hypothetical protein GOPIP_093_00250 [Gordonia polyisoprenivorans NBRC 16320 = JCM 10675]
MCEYGSVSSRKGDGLTSDDLTALSAGLATGKRVTVYLRDPMPSLNLDAGTSARVVSIEGSVVTVRPKGIDDQLPFEANELQRSQASTGSASPAQKRAARPAPAKVAAQPPVPAAPPVPSNSTTRKSESRPGGAGTAAPTPRTVNTSPQSSSAAPKAPRRAKTTTAAVSVTLTSTPAGSWAVSVSQGSKKTVRATEVTADRVARAMRELGNDAAIAAVDEVISAAREAAQRRIDELSHELQTARAALAHLEDQASDS